MQNDKLFPRLRDLREDRDMNQTQVANIIGTSQSYYAQYENGKREIPFSRIVILAKYYKVSIDYIAGLTNNKGGIGCDGTGAATIEQQNNFYGNGIQNNNYKKKR